MDPLVRGPPFLSELCQKSLAPVVSWMGERKEKGREVHIENG